MILDEALVAEYLTEHGLLDGCSEIEAALIQYGTPDETGYVVPAAMLVIDVDGRKVLAKTTLRMLLSIASALDGAAKRVHGDEWRGP